MEKRCDERVYNRIGMDFHGHICGRPIWKDGKCKIHHPESVADRDRKSEERYKEKNKIRTDNSAVIAELERQIHTMSIACRQDAIKLDALREENKRLRKALRFYADQKKYSICAAVFQFPDIVYDDGETARKTLNGEPYL